MFIHFHFFCLCPLDLATKLNFNISKEAYLKWPSFAKQIFAKQMLKRSIVPNLETTTKYGFPLNWLEEPAHGKPKKSRAH